MSEKIVGQHEQYAPRHESSQEHAQTKHERELTAAEKSHGSTEQLERLQRQVEQQAHSQQEISHAEREQNNQHPVFIRKDVKEVQFARTMTRVRKKLSLPSRTFSKVIHAPVIDKSSEFIGKTVARPSSMLSGAILAFAGTSALLWITKYNGYEYNYLAVILLFIGGAIIGVAGEGLWRLLRKNK